LFGLYLSAATFALATLASIVGAGLAEIEFGGAMLVAVGIAILSGCAGFLALVTAAASMVGESRLAMQSLALESEEALPAARPPL
jgi:uncharacterized membrane protein